MDPLEEMEDLQENPLNPGQLEAALKRAENPTPTRNDNLYTSFGPWFFPAEASKESSSDVREQRGPWWSR